MSAIVRWYSEEKTAILIEMPEEVSWVDFHNAVRAAHTLVNEVSYLVSIIIYPHTKLPDGNPLTQFRRAFSSQPDNVNQVIIVIPAGASRVIVPFVQRLNRVIESVYHTKQNVMFVHSLEEAGIQTKAKHGEEAPADHEAHHSL